MAKTMVRNLTVTPVTLPFPYNVVLPPGEGVVINDTTVNVKAKFDAGKDIGEVFDIKEVPDANATDVTEAKVKLANAAVFVSTEQTATGSAQNVAHGLGVAPAKVLVAVTELPDAGAEAGFDVAEGAHDATNVVVTVTANVKFKVLAWA